MRLSRFIRYQKMNYCPPWIYDAIFAQVGFDFLAHDLPLSLSAKKFTDGLSTKYQPLNLDEIEQGAEEMVRFLAEVDANENAVDLLRGFCFFRVRYETQNVKRKMKTLFGSVDAGDKTQKYSSADTVKRFKAYVFAWRSGTAILADPGWKLSSETALENLAAIAGKQVSVLDAI